MKRKYYILIADEIDGYTINQVHSEFNHKLLLKNTSLIKYLIERLVKKLDKALDNLSGEDQKEFTHNNINFIEDENTIKDSGQDN